MPHPIMTSSYGGQFFSMLDLIIGFIAIIITWPPLSYIAFRMMDKIEDSDESLIIKWGYGGIFMIAVILITILPILVPILFRYIN